MALLEIDQLEINYGRRMIVSEMSLQLNAGDIGCLLGPSGCGKTTVLRAVAGFEPVSKGRIRIRGVVVSEPGRRVPPEQRHVGMVFQDYALFPHLDIAANVGFGLERLPRNVRTARVQAMLALVGMASMSRRYPHELSGGQQQRVALARALAPSPTLILLDEPFSNLDAELREKLAQDVRAILKSTGTTALLVTHDQHEAFAIADRIGVIHSGGILQWSTAYDLYHHPVDRIVAGFVGDGAWLNAEVDEHGTVVTELGTLESVRFAGAPRARLLDVLIRPDDVVYDASSPRKARVVAKAFRGAALLYTLALPSGQELLALVASRHNHPLGGSIGIRLEVDHLIAFPH